jgi:hypothetical protein
MSTRATGNPPDIDYRKRYESFRTAEIRRLDGPEAKLRSLHAPKRPPSHAAVAGHEASLDAEGPPTATHLAGAEGAHGRGIGM